MHQSDDHIHLPILPPEDHATDDADLREPERVEHCANGPRPCPWASCEFHMVPLILSFDRGEGALGMQTEAERAAVEDGNFAALPFTCQLDAIALRGGNTEEESREGPDDAEPAGEPEDDAEAAGEPETDESTAPLTKDRAHGLSLDRIGKLVGVSRERIRQIEALCLYKLRARTLTRREIRELARDVLEPDTLDLRHIRGRPMPTGAVLVASGGGRRDHPAPPGQKLLTELRPGPGQDRVDSAAVGWCRWYACAMSIGRCAQRQSAHNARTDKPQDPYCARGRPDAEHVQHLLAGGSAQDATEEDRDRLRSRLLSGFCGVPGCPDLHHTRRAPVSPSPLLALCARHRQNLPTEPVALRQALNARGVVIEVVEAWLRSLPEDVVAAPPDARRDEMHCEVNGCLVKLGLTMAKDHHGREVPLCSQHLAHLHKLLRRGRLRLPLDRAMPLVLRYGLAAESTAYRLDGEAPSPGKRDVPRVTVAPVRTRPPQKPVAKAARERPLLRLCDARGCRCFHHLRAMTIAARPNVRLCTAHRREFRKLVDLPALLVPVPEAVDLLVEHGSDVTHIAWKLYRKGRRIDAPGGFVDPESADAVTVVAYAAKRRLAPAIEHLMESTIRGSGQLVVASFGAHGAPDLTPRCRAAPLPGGRWAQVPVAFPGVPAPSPARERGRAAARGEVTHAAARLSNGNSYHDPIRPFLLPERSVPVNTIIRAVERAFSTTSLTCPSPLTVRNRVLDAERARCAGASPAEPPQPSNRPSEV